MVLVFPYIKVLNLPLVYSIYSGKMFLCPAMLLVNMVILSPLVHVERRLHPYTHSTLMLGPLASTSIGFSTCLSSDCSGVGVYTLPLPLSSNRIAAVSFHDCEDRDW